MIHVLVTGKNGQVGQSIDAIKSAYPEMHIRTLDRSMLDLDDEASIQNAIKSYPCDYFINTAAYTAVDKAEDETALAFSANGMALYHITQCLSPSTKVIHLSSDYLYHNDPKRPLKESDPCLPKGIYAQSKLQGEQFLEDAVHASVIIRTSWVYSEFGHNFVKTMLKLGATKTALNIVADQIGSPTYAVDIAALILDIIQKSENGHGFKEGIYNFSNSGETNWADFARTIFKLKNLSCVVNNTTTEAYGAKAPRPLWSVMDKSKIQETYGIKLKSWEESLQECLLKL